MMCWSTLGSWLISTEELILSRPWWVSEVVSDTLKCLRGKSHNFIVVELEVAAEAEQVELGDAVNRVKKLAPLPQPLR